MEYDETKTYDKIEKVYSNDPVHNPETLSLKTNVYFNKNEKVTFKYLKLKKRKLFQSYLI